MLRFIFAFCFLPASVYAQGISKRDYDTLPTMVNHYYSRLAKFQAESAKTGEIVFLGNSITEGGDWKSLTDLSNTLNRGIGGDVTFGILNRLDEITTRKPSVIFLLIGINDIAQRVPDSVILVNYKMIVKRIKGKCPSTKIYIQSLLPLNPRHAKFPTRYNEMPRVLKLNAAIKSLCKTESIPFIDIFPIFLDKDGLLAERLTYDGLHLNREGYIRWSQFLREKGYLE